MVSGSVQFQGVMINLRPLRFPAMSVTMNTKVTVISITVGLTLLSFLARVLGRRRRNRPKAPDKLNPFACRRPKLGGSFNVTNGDVVQQRPSISPSMYRHRQGSISSDRQSVHSFLASTANLESSGAPANLSPQQLGAMGMEALETAIGYWEDALASYRPPPGELLALMDAEEGKFSHMLEKILDQSYKIQESCSHLFLSENSVLFKAGSVTSSSRHERFSESDKRTVTSASSVESFVSAQAEIADLQDFEEFADLNIDLKELALYQAALKKYEEGTIPIRLLRTEMLHCQTNMEYIAKVHCVRVAFQFLLQQDTVYSWFVNMGSKILTSLMLCGEKDPKDCLAAYDDIVSFSKDRDNWPIMEEELQDRGVRCLSFYDVVLDFIVLDAFEDLENPPSSVTAVVQNRWLTNGFKETALTTAIWSVLKAKKRMLKCSNGFISHFYRLSEHLIPVLAWGFLGPNEKLKEICNFFKEEVMGFMFDIFNFNKVQYTKVDELAADMMEIARLRFGRTCERLS